MITVIFNSVNRPINSTHKTVLRPINSTYKTNVFNNFFTFLTNFSINFNIAVDTSMNSNTLVCGKAPSGKDWYHIDTSQFTCNADQ